MWHLLGCPNIRLYGPIEDDAVHHFLDQQAVLEKDTPLVLELTTLGGDADAAKRIALEIRLCRKWAGRETYFIGKTAVMSAGITIMAAFPRENRYLTADTTLLIHERRIQKTLDLQGPLRAMSQIVREMLAQLENGERLERRAFAELAEGSNIGADDLYRRAMDSCYLTADEALELGLIARVI